MSYLQFLARWYNLAFLALALVGLASLAWTRLGGVNRFREGIALLVAAIAGLTCNGAIHDLGLGSPGTRFPYVLGGSALLGWMLSGAVTRFRNRHLRPISAVRFNRSGHEGTEARLVSRATGPKPGSGRAQWQDEEGALHIVHVHTEVEELGFGRRVILGDFDAVSESYRVRTVPRRRKRARGPDRASDG
jgi:hypothetical protein